MRGSLLIQKLKHDFSQRFHLHTPPPLPLPPLHPPKIKRSFGFLPKLQSWYFLGCPLPFCSGTFLMLFTELVLMVTIPAPRLEIHFYEKLFAYLYQANSTPSAVYSMLELYIKSESVISHHQSLFHQKRKGPCSQLLNS